MLTIASEADVEALLRAPGVAWLFKYSNRCGISSAALEEFSAYADAHPDEPAGVLTIQEHRPLSNWVAAKFGYAHQSPQLFMLRGGTVRWTATHWAISAAAMDKARG